jgi:hypothetical protein
MSRWLNLAANRDKLAHVLALFRKAWDAEPPSS